jgi:ribosome-associated protein
MNGPRFSPEDLAPWIEERFDRGGGPGGQHVNKVSTRVTVLFDFAACPLLSDLERDRIARRLHSRLSADGRLRLVIAEERSQLANREAGAARLIALLTEALHVPRSRRPTRPSAGSKRRRLADKRQRSETKQRRRGERTD